MCERVKKRKRSKLGERTRWESPRVFAIICSPDKRGLHVCSRRRSKIVASRRRPTILPDDACVYQIQTRDLFVRIIPIQSGLSANRAQAGREESDMAAPDWKPNKSYKLGDRVTIRYQGQAFLLLCMKPGTSGSTTPTIVRGGSKAPGREYETAVVRVGDGTCVWKWKVA